MTTQENRQTDQIQELEQQLALQRVSIDSLRATTRDYQALCEQVYDIVIIIDPADFTIQSVRHGVSQRSGTLLEQFKKLDLLFQAGPPFDKQTFMEHLSRAREGRLVRFDWQYWDNHGIEYWFDIVLKYIPAQPDGQIYIILRDMTEYKYIERAYKSSEESYWALFNRSLFWVYIHDLDGHLMNMNDEGLKAIGYSREELFGLTLDDIVHPDDLARAFQATERTVRHGKQLERQEYRIIGKDGSLIWIETDESVLYKDGQAYAIQGLAHDITERKRDAQELQRRYDFIHLIAQLSKDFINLSINGLLCKIKESLPDIAAFAQSDRAYVLRFDDDESILTNITEYARPGLPLLAKKDQVIPTAQLSYWMDRLRRSEIHFISSINDIPKENTLAYTLFESTDIKSILQIPLISHGKFIGILGLASVDRKSDWLEYHHTLLHLVGDIYANALDRVRVEESLRKESERLNRIMDMSPSGIIIVDQHGQIVFTNSRAEQVLGFTLTELSKSFCDLTECSITTLSGIRLSHDELPFYKVMRTGTSINNLRLAITWPNGKRVLLSVNAGPLYDQEGQMTGMIATVEDITAQYQIETALRESETKFRNIVESSPLGIHHYSLDENDQLIFTGANPAADKILRIDNSTFIGLTIQDAFPSMAETGLPEIFYEVAKYGKSHYFDQINYRGDTRTETFEVHAFQTSPGKMVSMFADITVRKRTDDELKQYRERLEVMVKERTSALEQVQKELLEKEKLAVLGQLTATVSHEIRNPLGSIRASLFAINDAVKRNEPYRVERAIELAERNIIRCDKIISELLDYTRSKTTHMKPTTINDWLINFLIEYVLPETIILKSKFDKDCWIDVDSENFRRVMINVINNAIHSMNDPSASGNQLMIETRQTATTIEILVIDQGCGIDSAIKDKVFEPLFSTKGFGVGLGLVIVKQIMEQHNGSVFLESEPGRGTTVRLVFPLTTHKAAP